MPTCRQCKHEREATYFQPRVVRRSKLTATCSICRNTHRRSTIKPTTKKGKCRAYFEKWKENQACGQCNIRDCRLMEADHQTEFKKVHRCSNYAYWASHGGVKALEEELKKCKPLCRFCHRLKTKAERKKQSTKSKVAKQDIINAEKLKRGSCMTCKRTVTLENACAFDFDHVNPENKRMNVSHFVLKDWEYFRKYCKDELAKCRLLCTNCHKIKTYY